MWRRASLLIWLSVWSVVALTSAESTSTTVGPTQSSGPTSTVTTKKDRNRQKKRRTTTTSTADPEDENERTVFSSSTTVDPRSFDHTDLGHCEIPLGMENGLVSNDSLTASSSYDQSVSALSSRIRTELRGGAWCPNGLISPKSRQYLEIDFKGEYLITASESQGRFANSVGVEFVERYFIEYWRSSLGRWVMYRDFTGSRLLPGNVNTYMPRKTVLEAPFVASKVRIFPFAAHPRTACMRVELYGCKWKQGLVAYSAPMGCDMQKAMSGSAKFEDLTYDGVVDNEMVNNGLGQMTDSLSGPNDFELLDPDDTRGSRWVGWNRTMLQRDVPLIFNFTSTRIFTYIDLHTNNMFTKDVQLFKTAEVYFSLEGERWQEDFISYEPKQDRVSEHARVVHIELGNRTAKHIQIKLRFQHEWILISEITFKSVPIKVNMSSEFRDNYYRTENPPATKTKRNNSNSSFKMSVGLAFAGTVGAGAFIAAAVVFFMKRPAVVDEDYREPYNIWRETLGHKDKRDYHSTMDQNEYNEICDEIDFPRSYLMKKNDSTERFYAATDILHHTYPDERIYRRERHVPGLFTSIKLPEAEPPNGVAPLLDFPRGRIRPVTFLGEGSYGTVQICETDGIEELNDEETQHGERRRLVVVKTLWRGCHNDIKTAFAREATWGAGLKHPQLARVLGLSLQEPLCAALDRGNATALPTLLKMDKKLNYGTSIHICCQVAAGMKYLESFELVHRDLAARNVTVTEDFTVKVSDYAMFCEEFVGDYYMMADSTKIPLRWMAWESLLLVCSNSYEDIPFIFRLEEPDRDLHLNTEQTGILIIFKRCFQLRLTMTSNQGMFSPASDVWSFGVTVWEVLTDCSAKPFEEMLDEQVVDNATEWRKGGRGARIPAAPPPRCRRELYDLMHECWRREPAQRPRFNDLHRFLERMSHGYKPPSR